MKKTSLTISLVIPCFNEQAVLSHTLERIKTLHANYKKRGWQCEVLWVDDGSKDHTRQILTRACQQNKFMKLLGFSRNFGQQLAFVAGIEHATGDAVVLMDADLQDPPEVITQMIETWQKGYHVVYGVRKKRLGETFFKKFTSKLFYRVLNYLSDVPIPLDAGDFRLMDRQVVAVLKSMPERLKFIRGMVAWVGFRQTAVYFERAKRMAGVTKFPLRRLLRFAVDGILSFSIKPLRLAIWLGFLVSMLAVVGILWVLAVRIFTDNWVAGWTALMIVMMFLGGVQLMALGLVGEYIGRIYNEVKQRPAYVLEMTINLNSSKK